MATILANTYAIGYIFIIEKFAETVCQVFEIESQCLIKPKQLKKFDNRAAKPIIHAIYLILIIGTDTKSLAFLLITKLGNYSMIFSQLLMKKYGVIINMTNNFLAFWLGYCKHIGAIFLLSLSSLLTQIVDIKIKKDIISQKMIKRALKENITDFLQMPNKLSNKNKKQINKSKRKINIGETSSRITIISNLESFDKKELPVFIPITKVLKFKAKDIDIAIISIDTCCIACCLKRASRFAISMRDIQYQVEKKAKTKIDSKSIIS